MTEVLPKAGPAPIINIGESHQFTLKNGLKVIVVEDHKFPLITYSLNLNIDPVDEGNATGYVQLVGDMMRAGTANRTKDQIDEEADFIGYLQAKCQRYLCKKPESTQFNPSESNY